MRQTRRLILGIFLSIAIPYSLQCFSVSTTDEVSIRSAILEAQQLQQKASDLGFEWTTIAPLIQSALAHLKAGELDSALLKAEEAKTHAQLAIQQAQDAAQQWQFELPPKQ